MKTNFEFNNFKQFNKHLLSLILIIGSSFYMEAQEIRNDTSNLKVVALEFPDTINYGETLLLRFYLKNVSNSSLETDVSIYFNNQNYEIHNYVPNYDDISSDSEGYKNVVIEAGDSILLSKQIDVTAPNFNPNTNSIIIIWPEIASLRSQENYTLLETFVVDNVREDLNTKDEVIADIESKESENDFENKKLTINSSFDAFQSFEFLNNGFKTLINKTSNDVEFLSANVFNLEGKILQSIDTNSNFPVEILSQSSPIVVNLNIRKLNQPNKIYKVSKVFFL